MIKYSADFLKKESVLPPRGWVRCASGGVVCVVRPASRTVGLAWFCILQASSGEVDAAKEAPQTGHSLTCTHG